LLASTALAPLAFMPGWLAWIASLNPMSYAIEAIRYLYLHRAWTWSSVVMDAPFGPVTMAGALAVLAGFCGVAVLLIQPALKRSLN
jgi:ABC-2 type transport system permease protein